MPSMLENAWHGCENVHTAHNPGQAGAVNLKEKNESNSAQRVSAPLLSTIHVFWT